MLFTCMIGSKSPYIAMKSVEHLIDSDKCRAVVHVRFFRDFLALEVKLLWSISPFKTQHRILDDINKHIYK